MPLPEPRHGHQAELVCGEVIVVGGSGSPRSRETWLQSGASEGWRRGDDLREGKSFFRTVLDGTDLYAIGGSIERYDHRQDRWELVLPGTAFPRSHFGAARIGRRIVAIGGFPIERSRAFAFDIDTQAVTELMPPPGFEPGDHLHFVVALRERLHVIGGLGSAGPMKQHWILEPGGSWSRAKQPPFGVFSKFAIFGAVEERFYCFVGLAPDSESIDEATGLCYDPATDRWHSVEAAPTVLAMPASIVRGNELHVIGGRPVQGSITKQALVFDASTETWTPNR